MKGEGREIMSQENKNKIKKAAALKYSPDENSAPQVVASGMGEIAEKIIKTAEESLVPVYKDEALADSLSKLKAEEEIPRELYEVVAEILVFVCNLDLKYGEAHGKK
jgi:flagellar biosynthesis protein